MRLAVLFACHFVIAAMPGALGALEPPEGAEVTEEVGRESPAGRERLTDPSRPDLVQQGRHNLNVICSRCHGRDGKGAKGPSLVTGRFRRARTDEDLIRVMTVGIQGTGMPGLGPFDEFWEPIVAYLRSEAAHGNAENNDDLPQGNPAHGYELFKKHQCANCHWTGSDGGRLGTDLSKIAATPVHVRRVLTDPDAHRAGEFQRVRLEMEDGLILEGRRLYENKHFVLLMDQQENLHTISTRQASSVVYPEQSLMPSYRLVLSPQEIEDLITYVFSLRKD